MSPSGFFARRDLLTGLVLMVGIFSLTLTRPQQSRKEMRIKLQGSLNAMSGSELAPMMVPALIAYITLEPANN